MKKLVLALILLITMIAVSVPALAYSDYRDGPVVFAAFDQEWPPVIPALAARDKGSTLLIGNSAEDKGALRPNGDGKAILTEATGSTYGRLRTALNSGHPQNTKKLLTSAVTYDPNLHEFIMG
jgi:hypothetical protein